MIVNSRNLGCAQTATKMDGHATKRPCVYDRPAHTAITTQHGGRFVLVFREFDDGSPSFQRVYRRTVPLTIRLVFAYRSGLKVSWKRSWPAGRLSFFALREAHSATPACRCTTEKHLPNPKGASFSKWTISRTKNHFHRKKKQLKKCQKEKKINDSNTNWWGTVFWGQKTVKKTHFRLQFACNLLANASELQQSCAVLRKRLSIALKSCRENWCDLMRMVLHSTAGHEAAWCKLIHAYILGSSRYRCAARSFRRAFGVQQFRFAGTFLRVGSKLYISLRLGAQ